MKQLNFGAGKDIRKGFDNVDIEDFDFNIFPYPVAKNTFDAVYCRHVLEHLEYPKKVLNELHRICKPNACIHIEVPHLNQEGAFSTLSHKSYFSKYSFMELGDKFEILSIEETPTEHFGYFIPKFMRKKLSMIIRGIFKLVIVDLRVIK